MTDLFNTTDKDLFLINQYFKRKSSCILSPEYGQVIGFKNGLQANMLRFDRAKNMIYLETITVHSNETIERISIDQYHQYYEQLIKELK